MSENLEDLTPNQRRALGKALSALETMAAIWGAEIRINEVAQKLASKPEPERAKAIAAFIEQAFIEGAYRHYLDRDPAANPQLASQPGSAEAVKFDAPAYDPHVEKWRLDSEELEAFHMSMDKHGVPRATKFGVQMSAFGRAVKFAAPPAGNGEAKGGRE